MYAHGICNYSRWSLLSVRFEVGVCCGAAPISEQQRPITSLQEGQFLKIAIIPAGDSQQNTQQSSGRCQVMFMYLTLYIFIYKQHRWKLVTQTMVIISCHLQLVVSPGFASQFIIIVWKASLYIQWCTIPYLKSHTPVNFDCCFDFPQGWRYWVSTVTLVVDCHYKGSYGCMPYIVFLLTFPWHNRQCSITNVFAPYY